MTSGCSLSLPPLSLPGFPLWAHLSMPSHTISTNYSFLFSFPQSTHICRIETAQWVRCQASLYARHKKTHVSHSLGVYRVVEESWWLRQYTVHPQCRRPGFDSWVRKIPWKRKWKPTPVYFPGEFHGQKSLVGYSPWVTKSRTQLKLLSAHIYGYRYE